MSDEPTLETTGCDTEPSLCALAGLITDEEAREMRTAIRDLNQRQREQLGRVADMMSE